jgi:hypothetical protein
MLAYVSVLGLMLLTDGGCGEYGNVDYTIGFLNKTGHDLDEVSTYNGNKAWALPTPLVTGGNATEHLGPMPIPDEVEVRIVDHGEQRVVTVSLKDVPRSGFDDGHIYLVFNADGTVEVRAFKAGDTNALFELGRSVLPKGGYKFGFVNRTGHDLQAVSVYYGDKQAGVAGDILARVRVGYSNWVTSSIPPEAEVRWDEDGKHHTVNAKFDGTVPKGYAEGNIYFVIKEGDAVEVHPIKWGDDAASIALCR